MGWNLYRYIKCLCKSSNRFRERDEENENRLEQRKEKIKEKCRAYGGPYTDLDILEQGLAAEEWWTEKQQKAAFRAEISYYKNFFFDKDLDSAKMYRVQGRTMEQLLASLRAIYINYEEYIEAEDEANENENIDPNFIDFNALQIE